MYTPQNTRQEPASRVLEAVTFDVTHTLIHAPEMAEIYRQVLARHGTAVSLNELEREIPRVWQEMACRADPRYDRFAGHAKGAKGWWQSFLARVCQRLEVPPPTPFAGAELFDRFAHPAAWSLYDDVAPTLSYLQDRGLRLGIVSNWDHRLPELLDRLGLLSYFDVVTYSSAAGVEKPHGKIFRDCLEALGVEPGRAMHVGDRALEDIEGALAVGMHAVRIDRSEAKISLLELIRPMLRQSPLRRPGWAADYDVDEGHHGLR